MQPLLNNYAQLYHISISYLYIILIIQINYLHLMVDNSLTYNGDENEVTLQAIKLREIALNKISEMETKLNEMELKVNEESK